MNSELRDFKDLDIMDRLVVLFQNQQEIMKKLEKEKVVINSPITVNQNLGEDISKHLYDILDKVQQRQTQPKVVTKEEFIERLQKVDFDKLEKGKGRDKAVTSQNENFPLIGPTRNLYKKNLKTNEYILVGYIDSNSVIDFYSYKERTKPFVPNIYDSDWYVMKPIKSADGNIYPTYNRVVPNLSDRFLTQIGISKTYGVIGFKDKYDRDIYWDYFVQ